MPSPLGPSTMNNNMNDESSEQTRKTEKEKSINSSSDSSSNDSNNNAEASTEIFHQHLTVEENDINTVNDDTEIASESPSRASVGGAYHCSLGLPPGAYHVLGPGFGDTIADHDPSTVQELEQVEEGNNNSDNTAAYDAQFDDTLARLGIPYAEALLVQEEEDPELAASAVSQHASQAYEEGNSAAAADSSRGDVVTAKAVPTITLCNGKDVSRSTVRIAVTACIVAFVAAIAVTVPITVHFTNKGNEVEPDEGNGKNGVISGRCADNPLWRGDRSNGVDHDCEFVAQNPGRRCSWMGMNAIAAEVGCPKTCGVCRMGGSRGDSQSEEVEPQICEDDPSWYGRDENASCSMVALNPSVRCNWVNTDDGTKAKEACAKTCAHCDGTGLVARLPPLNITCQDDLNCYDDPTWRGVNSWENDCDWVAMEPARRCKWTNAAGVEAQCACIMTCNDDCQAT